MSGQSFARHRLPFVLYQQSKRQLKRLSMRLLQRLRRRSKRPRLSLLQDTKPLNQKIIKKQVVGGQPKRKSRKKSRKKSKQILKIGFQDFLIMCGNRNRQIYCDSEKQVTYAAQNSELDKGHWEQHKTCRSQYASKQPVIFSKLIKSLQVGLV